MSDVSATFVVVGGGIAGVSVVQRLLQLCPGEPVLLVSGSEVVKVVTDLSHLTKLISSFQVREASGQDFQRGLSGAVKLLTAEVRHIDPHARQLITVDGRKIGYRFACLCQGARPRLIQAQHEHVLGLRDTESVAQFEKRISAARRIVIVGNGGIATELVFKVSHCQVVWAIKDQSVNATFVDAAAGQFLLAAMNRAPDQNKTSAACKRVQYSAGPYPRPEGAAEVQGSALGPDWLQGNGVSGSLRGSQQQVNIQYSCHVTRLLQHHELNEEDQSRALDCSRFFGDQTTEHDWNVYVELSNGTIFGCDFVVSATGVIPNGDMITVLGPEQLALSGDGAVLVDEHMKTNIDGVFAAGDVCQVKWTQNRSPHWFQMRLWTQARQMGMYAAQCMDASLNNQINYLMLDFCFEMFTHVTQFFGFKVILLGLFNGQTMDNQYEVLLRVTEHTEFVKVVMKDGRMQGAILIGETDLEETFENLILNQLDLSSFGVDLLDPNIDIEDFFD